MRRDQPHIDPFVRNIGILVRRRGGCDSDRTDVEPGALGAVPGGVARADRRARALAYRVWRENRGTFSLMSTRLRLDALRIGARARARDRDFVALGDAVFSTSLLFFGLIGGLGYVIWRVWEESRRYYY